MSYLQRFAEVLILCEGSFQLSAFSKYKKLRAEGLHTGSIPWQAALGGEATAPGIPLSSQTNDLRKVIVPSPEK
jgi:hypothetical protein